MKIALLTDTYEPEVNGVATSVRTLRRGLLDAGHEVTVFAPSHPNATKTPGVVRVPSVAFKPIHERRLATPVDLSIRSQIMHGGFDIIHTHTEFSIGQFGFRAAKSLEIPHIHTYHTMYEEYTWYITRGLFEGTARKLVKRVSRYICERCDRIIAPTQKTLDALRSYGVDTPISVIPTGVDLSRFTEAAVSDHAVREEHDIAPDAQVLLSLGRVANEKRIGELISAFSTYIASDDQRRANVVLLVVGDGPAYKSVREQVKTLGISNRVHFTGEVPWDTISDYYHAADVFVSMSESETQGLTYIEALAAGTPVVAQYNECFDGILEDSVSASLFRDPAEFGSRIDEMLFSDKRASYIERGQQAAQALSIEVFARNAEVAYQTSIDRYVPRPSRLRRILS